MSHVDGDDMTYWWQVADSAGAFDSDVLSDVTAPQTLYGTMTGGDVAGLSLVDVPQTYNTQTAAENTRSALWHIGKRTAEIAEDVRNLQTDRASLFEAVRGIHNALAELQQRLDDMTADS